MAERDEFDLPMPLGGVSDDLAFSKQNLATTREALNARAQDPLTGRERISQRAGLSKANDAKLDGANRVVELNLVTYDSRNLTYSDDVGTQEWLKETPAASSILHLEVDKQGNVYFTDGQTGVAKMNPDGELVWAFPLPAADKDHSVRFVHVDDLFDVYVGTSTGKRSEDAQLWKLTQLPDDEVEIAWEVRPGAWIERARVYRDKLYTLQNDPRNGIAYMRVYRSLDALAPELVQAWRVPFPANDFDINTAGEVAVASTRQDNSTASNVNRFNPKWPRTAASGFPLFPQVEDWNPRDLDEFDKRIWSWFRADDISQFDVAGPLADGVKILRWPDRSGKNRNLYEPGAIGMQPPTLALDALGTRAAVRFNGVDQALVSLSNSSTKKQYADQQRTAWPAYEGSMFATVIVCRPEKRDSGNPMFIMGQANAASGATDHIVFANRASGTSTSFSSGVVSHYAATDGTGDGGRGTNGHPVVASFDNDHDAAIIVILWDGGIDPNSTSVTRSLFQLNGSPIDRYEGLGNFTKEPTILGWWDTPSSGIDPLSGDILEIFTLDRMDRDDDSTEPKVLTHDQLENTSSNVDQTANELTKLVGYFAHYYGLSHLLPDDTAQYTHPYGRMTANVHSHSFVDVLTGPPEGGYTGNWGKAIRNYPCITKWSPTGELVWTLNGEDTDPSDSNGLNGVGYAVRFDPDGNLFSLGPDSELDGSPSTRFVRKVIDQGDSYSVQTADGAWSASVTTLAYGWPRIDVDPAGNLYVPLAAGSDRLKVYKGDDGTLLREIDVGVPSKQLFAVAIDPRIPDYGDDLTTEVARFVYVGAQAGTDPSIPIFKYRLVAESPLTGSPRAMTVIGISAGGLIRRFTVGGSTMFTPTGATGALDAAPVYVQSASGFEKVYITDSVSPIQVYDPRTDTVAALVSSTPGDPPHGAKLLELWRGRLFAARAPALIGGAFAWAASRVGDPTDWNNFPAERDVAAAIASTNEFSPGMCPDIINCLIPMGDDFLAFGCDHSIYLLSGDPGEGARFDEVSSVEGIAFGRPYCQDPDGNIWFVGSRGGLFHWPKGGRPQRISLRSVEERLRSINFETHYVRLAWNHRDYGVMIYRFPFGNPGDPVEHWFFDQKRGGFWPDTYGTTTDPTIEPTAVFTVDGDDPDDRVMLLGGRDGYVRKWDKDANDDDGYPTDFNVLIGPLSEHEAGREYRFVGPRVVLASDQDGAEFQLYATDDPAQLGSTRGQGVLHPGRNPLRRARMRGSYCFVRIRNSVEGQRASIEAAAMRSYPAGLRRVRNTP